MKLYVVFNLVLIIKLVNGADLSCERKVLESNLENEQLHKTISELKIEIGSLRLELLTTKEKENLHAEENELTYLNCSGLSTHIEVMSSSLSTLQSDVESFKPLINEKVTAYERKFKNIDQNTINAAKRGASAALLNVDEEEELFAVACSAKRSNDTWTVIQRRMDGKTNFYRPWAQYKAGFGTMTGEFFIGLENLHLLTTCVPQELLIEMMDSDNQRRHANYDLFEIDGERESYALKKLGAYSGNAGDSLTNQKSQKFSTYDQENDQDDARHCAQRFRGAWWYKNCHRCNLNGEFGNNKFGEGITWFSFRGNEHSLKFVEIKIRPKTN